MGTRADFYIGDGPDAEWLGSIAWDGDEIPHTIAAATDAESFRAGVAELASRDDWTPAEAGWPWPWDDSGTTDYAYALIDGTVFWSRFGRPWHPAAAPEDENCAFSARCPACDEEKACRASGSAPNFPDMRSRKNVVWAGPRSGLLVIGG